MATKQNDNAININTIENKIDDCVELSFLDQLQYRYIRLVTM